MMFWERKMLVVLKESTLATDKGAKKGETKVVLG